MDRRWLIGIAALLAAVAGPAAGLERTGRYQGRPVAEVLSELARGRIRLVFSSRLVRPEMRVREEPTSRAVPAMLTEILAPYGLRLRPGPKGGWLVVTSPSPPPARPSSAATRPGQGAIRVAFRRRGSSGHVAVRHAELRGAEGTADVGSDGWVLISGLTPGPHYLEAAVPGHPFLSAALILVRESGTAEVAFELEPREDASIGGGDTLDQVVLQATRGVDHQETVDALAATSPMEATRSTVSASASELMRGAGHGGNVLTPLQSFPGVKNGRDFDGRLVIRGGAPEQNLVLLDGVEVLGPYHAWGLASVFQPASVDSLELTAGGFDVGHGDRLSSLVSVTSREMPRAERTTGSAGIGLFDADLTVEGRLPHSLSWLLAGRYAYADWVAGSVLDEGAPHFGDLLAKLSWERRPGQRWSWLGMLGREGMDYRETDDIGENWTLHTRVPTRLSRWALESTLGSSGMSRSILSVYELHDSMSMQGDVVSDARGTTAEPEADGRVAHVSFSRGARVRDWSVRQELRLQQTPRSGWEMGGEAHRLETAWRWQIDGDRSLGLANRSLPWPYGLPGAALPGSLDAPLDYWRGALWLQHRAAPTHWLTTEAGLRADRSSLATRPTLSPRLLLALSFGTAARLWAHAGAYAQSPGNEKLLQSDYFLDLSSAGSLRSERAIHTAVGIEGMTAGGVTIRAEGYRRTYHDLLVGRLETEDERRARIARYDFGSLVDDVPTEPQITSYPSNDGRGVSYGVDVRVSKDATARGRPCGWVSYSYSVARREAYGVSFPADYDRRHSLSAVAQLQPHPSVTVAATLRIASGAPWTPPAGLRVAAREDQADGDGDGDTSELIPARDLQGHLIYTHDLGDPSRLNSARLPHYARLDARVTYRPRGPQGRVSLYLDVINLLNRTNPGLMSCRVGGVSRPGFPVFVESPESSVPLLPSLGVRVVF